MSILVPSPGDYSAWTKKHDIAIAVDWDGTCKDTMGIKWKQGFNLAVTKVWPALAPFQKQVDEICYRENLAPGAVSAQRFLMLRKMMGMWKGMGLPVPDLAKFSKAIDHVEQLGQSHGTETYRKLQGQFGYDDTPMRWSDLSDELIGAASPTAPIFPNCIATLEKFKSRADLVVVSAAKSSAVKHDLIHDKMEHLFLALLGQDFAPKKSCLIGLKQKYGKIMFTADGAGDRAIAQAAGVMFHEIRIGDEAASWIDAGSAIEKFLASEQ